MFLPIYVFCSSFVLVFLCFILLLIARSCHCPVCVRLSHSIKDYLLTYLLTPNVARRDERSSRTSCGPRSRLWDLPLSHLSPSLRVIPCEYVDDLYIAES